MAGCISTYRRWRALCALMLLALASVGPASARIKQMSLDDRPLALMEKFHTRESSFPGSLATDRDVFVVIYAASASSDVYVLAQPSVDPRQLARILESAVRGTPLASEPVMYMSGKGYSWADAYVSSSRMWSRRSEMRQPVGLIISRLQEAGLKPHVLLYALNSAKPSHKIGLWGHVGRKSFVGQVPPSRKDIDFTLRSHVSSRDLLRAFLLFFAVPIIGIVAIPILTYIARVKRATPGGRRALLTGWLFWLMMLGTILEFTVFRSQFQSPWRYRLQDLWFGEGETAPMLMIPLMASWALIAIGHVIGRVVFRGDAPESQMLGSLRRRNVIFVAAFMAFSLAAGYLSRYLPQDSLLARSPIAVVMLLSFLVPGVYARIMRSRVRMAGPRTPDSELHQRLSDLARRSGIDLNGVTVVDTSASKSRLADVLYHRDGTLLVPRELADRLSPEELDFMAAHEFALAAQGGRTKAAVIAWASAILIVIPGILLVTQPLNLSLLNWPFWCVAAGFALLALDANAFGKRRDAEADRRALTLTGDPKTAVEALRKAAGALDTSDILDPKSRQIRVQITLRLLTLKKAIERMGLDPVADFRERVQDDTLTARAQEIAEHLGVKLNKVEVIAPLTGEKLVNAGALRGSRIVVGRALLESFSPEEIDFVLAHELAHLKRRHVAKMLTLMLTGLAAIIAGTALVTSGLSIPTSGYWIPMLGVALSAANMTWLSRRRELEADRMALRTTRDLPAAISALDKLARGIEARIPEEMEGYMTHPKNVYRVRSLRREAVGLGLPDVEVRTDTEQTIPQ